MSGLFSFIHPGFSQTTNDVILHYSYDEDGNRLLESVTTGTAQDTSVSVAISQSNDTEQGTTANSPVIQQTVVGITPSGGTPPYTYLWQALSTCSSCPNSTCDSSAYAVTKNYWTATVGINTTFGTSCGQSSSCSFCAEWQLTVTDSLGTQASTQPTLLTNHVYTPS